MPGKVAGPIGYLTNVYLAPATGTAGSGRGCSEQALDWCRAERFSCVIMWPTPRSRPFYRRGGFDRLDEPFIIDLGPEDLGSPNGGPSPGFGVPFVASRTR